MTKLIEKIQYYSNAYDRIKTMEEYAKESQLPGKTYFIDKDEIMALPRDDGDCRYPYGSDGFYFWAYASGYMHGNEGIFSPFLRALEGQEPKIAFFAGIPTKENQDENSLYETVPLLSVPIMNTKIKTDQFTVFTKSCVYYITRAEDLRFGIRVFVNKDKKIIFSITAENLSNKGKDIMLSSFFNPFLVHAISESGDDRWFREVRYGNQEEILGDGEEEVLRNEEKVVLDNGNKELGYFLIKTNEDLSRTRSISNYGVIKRSIHCGKKSKLVVHEETTSRYAYVGGSRGSLHSPKGVKKGTFDTLNHVCTFTEVGAAGDIIKLHIGEKDAIRLDITFDYIPYCDDNLMVQKLINSKINPIEMDDLLDRLKVEEKEKASKLTIEFGKSKLPQIKTKVYNSFLEHLKKQVEFCALMKGYIQAYVGSLIGIRDIFQALEALIAWEPDEAKRKMLEALDFTAPNGRCPRQYSIPANEEAVPEMDLRPFIDQGVWVISTIVTYLKYTNDFSFLEEECGYYEIIDEKKKLVKKSSIRDSVLEHMIKIMNYLISNRDFEITKCVRALYGDWNDALDGLGVSNDPEQEYGSGVSVMASLQVYQNLKEMEELLYRLDSLKYQSLIKEYQTVRQEIQEGLYQYGVVKDENSKTRIVHGWGDKVSYYVGSFQDPDHKSRQGLTSNAFWVLSGLYDEDMSMKHTILEAFHNLDSKYGLKTFEPYFEPDTKGVGRIPKLPAGTAENGAAYIHASMFGIMALFRMGYSEMAWTQLLKSLPFTHEYISCSPYIMPNSYCYNKELNMDGESMADWQTGSSNVLLKLLMKYVYGINPEYEGIWLQPALYVPFESMELHVKVKNCNLHIYYKETWEKVRIYKVNGVQRNGVYDKVMNLNKLWITNEELKCKELNIEVLY